MVICGEDGGAGAAVGVGVAVVGCEGTDDSVTGLAPGCDSMRGNSDGSFMDEGAGLQAAPFDLGVQQRTGEFSRDAKLGTDQFRALRDNGIRGQAEAAERLTPSCKGRF